jgi:nucleoside-diphosphate-sugar epimerase
MAKRTKLLYRKAVILGATGPTGIFLARSLKEKAGKLRVVSRSMANLEQAFAEEDAELVAGDLLDPADVRRSIQGCDLAINCLGLPAEHMDGHVVAARNIAEAIRGNSIRCLHVSSYWSYLPLVSLPISEDHPRSNGSDWMRYRREAEDILQKAGSAVVHLPDFFGPFVHTSTLQNLIREAFEGSSKLNCIGRGDVKRDYIYVPDAAKIISRLVQLPEAFGARWVLKGSGPISGEEVRTLLSSLLNRRMGLRCAGPLMLRLVSLFKRDLRGFLQMVPEYVKPISYDDAKLAKYLDEIEHTEYRDALSQTLKWFEKLK